jgi:hypothetical protein
VHLGEQLRRSLFATCVRLFFSLCPPCIRPPHRPSATRAKLITHITSLHPSSPTSSDPLSEQKLAKGDVVKVHLGAHIDGFAAISAETIVVGATLESPVTGRRADALRAAWAAAEVAMRLVRVGNKNWQITEAVGKVAAAWDCKPVEGAFRCCCLCSSRGKLIPPGYRYVVVPADAKCDRWEETYHPQPERGTEEGL